MKKNYDIFHRVTLMFSFLCVTVVCLFVASCNKKKSKEYSQINYEIDGVPFELKSKDEITFSFAGALQVQGTGKEKPTRWLFLKTPNLFIRVKDTIEAIKPGVYSGSSLGLSGEKGVQISYTTANETFYETGYVGQQVSEVLIKELSRKGVKGTFRGWVINNFDTIKFENGEFSIFTYEY